MAVIDKLKSKKQVEYVHLRVKVEKEFADMIDYICEANSVDKAEYLTEIMMDSEISTVYKKMQKQKGDEAKKKAKDEQEQESGQATNGQNTNLSGEFVS